MGSNLPPDAQQTSNKRKLLLLFKVKDKLNIGEDHQRSKSFP